MQHIHQELLVYQRVNKCDTYFFLDCEEHHNKYYVPARDCRHKHVVPPKDLVDGLRSARPALIVVLPDFVLDALLCLEVEHVLVLKVLQLLVLEALLLLRHSLLLLLPVVDVLVAVDAHAHVFAHLGG